MFVMLMKTKSSLCGLFYQVPWQRRTLVCLKLNSVTVRTLDDARSLTLWYLGLEPEILMFIAYAQKPPVNAHAGVSSWNMFSCYMGVYLHPYFVYASCEGFGENAHLCRLAWAFIVGLYDMCQNLVSLPNNITFVPGTFVQKLMRDTCDWIKFSRLSSWLMVDTCN